jgi:hypothetical protein
MRILQSRIRAGRWTGLIEGAGDAPPTVEVVHLDRPLDSVAVTPAAGEAGRWTVDAPIPAELLSDGVQTFVVRDGGTGERLAHFTIVTGVPLEDDIRAEVDLLRAELDLLKKAFRRHCIDGQG